MKRVGVEVFLSNTSSPYMGEEARGDYTGGIDQGNEC